MEQALLNIGYIGILLLFGLLSSIISRKLKIPNLLILLGVGVLIGYATFNGKPIFELPQVFLTSIAIITLAMVVFDSSSKFNFRRFDTLSVSALKLSLTFLFLNILLITPIIYYTLNPTSILIAVIFAAVISGTDPSSTMMVLGGARTRLFELLKVESILNTPLIVLIPFLLINIITGAEELSVSLLSTQIIPFTQQFVGGIGTGVLVSLIFFRFMKKHYSQTLSPLALITSALLTYIGAEAIGGNGVLAVTTAGLMFGNLYQVKHKKKLQEFGEIFAELFEILVFILIGSVIKIPLTVNFFATSIGLFAAYLFVRYMAIEISTRKAGYLFKEKIYMTANIPKGIAVAVVVFTLATKPILGLSPILDLILAFMIYSIILSTIITHFSKYFTKISVKVTEKQ